MKKKALLIKLSSLGDVIFNIPLANSLKDAGYEVTWLVSEKGFDVVNNNPCVDRTILIPIKTWKKRGPSIQSFKEYLTILKDLRAQKFDVAIDSQMLLKSFYWLAFCGAKRRIISKEAREFSMLGGNEWIDNISVAPDSQIVMNYLQYAKYLGIEVNEKNIKVTLPPRSCEQIQKVNELLSNIDNSKPIVSIAPATTWENKHWNKDNWREVVKYLSTKCNLVFTGGPNDKDLIEYISQGAGINIAGQTNLLELAEVYSRSNLVIAPDSGSAHLAWAAKNPKVIVIFTCTPKDVLGPLGDKNKYAALGEKKFDCQPCFKRKCALKSNINACTHYPNAKDVISKTDEMLNEL